MNRAFEKIDQLADEMVFKVDGAERLSHAQRVAEFLQTPEGARLYEQGKLSHGRDFERLDRVEKSAPVTKRDDVWNTIQLHAQQRQRDSHGRVSFAKAVDAVLRDYPELYAHYRNS
jgi:hypothetical protein